AQFFQGGELAGRPGALVFVAVWLILWTLAGGFVVYAWLRNVAGREVVTLSPGTLSLRRQVLGFGRTREFELAHVRDLRVVPLALSPWFLWWGMSFWGLGPGSLSFDYGAKTYRFAAGLDEAEAKLLLAELQRHLPAAA